MKKLSLTVLALAALMFFSCEEKKKEQDKTVPTTPPKVKVVALDEIPGIVEAHGTVGDGTSMNVLEFVNDDGDTLYISKGAQSVMGGVVAGDELEVIYNVTKEDVVASVAVNLTALQHLWRNAEPMAGSRAWT